MLELYVLGMANEQETAEVIALAKKYSDVASEIKTIELSLENYAQAHAISPAESTKEKIFSRIHKVPVTSIRTHASGPGKIVHISSWKYAAAVAVLLLVTSIAINFLYYDKFRKSEQNLATVVNEKNNAEQRAIALERSNQDMKNDMSVVQSKYSEPVALHGLQAAPDAAAKIFWMKNTGDVYIDPSNLPDAPAGKQYQLWAIVDGKPVDGGMIVTNNNGEKFRIQKMKTFGKAEAFAVTLETEGGNPTPKGDMFVMGKM
ncbi:MAG: anti-sigma factor [Ferruginibacter sp.]